MYGKQNEAFSYEVAPCVIASWLLAVSAAFPAEEL